MPRDEKPSESVRRDRFDFAPQSCERAASQAPEHIGIDPFALDAAGPELTLHEPPRFRQARQERLGDRRAEAESSRERINGERTMRASESQREIAGWVTDRLEQGLGNARW